MAKTSLGTKKFRRWWKGINSHESTKRKEIIRKWLKYACRTVSLRGDQDQQRVVYTTYNRYCQSQYKVLRKWQALTVYRIVNQQQENFRKQKTERTLPQKPVVKVVKRRIISRRKVGGHVRIG